MSVRIIVIDDQPLEGQMIDYVLRRDCPYAEYAGQAYTIRSGVELAGRVRADLAFLDITMPGGDGIGGIRALREVCPELRIVMLTAHDDFEYIRAAMREGANDYLLKPTRPRDVVEAVERWSARAETGMDDPVEAAKRYVENHLDQAITLADVAERLYLSPTYFSRLFKTRTGSTFSAWLAHRRVDRARRYLTETQLTVGEIAARVGYREANSFTRLFRQSEGVSPTEYRKREKTES